MRPWLSIAAAALLLSAACSPFGGAASASPHPSPPATPSPSPSPSPTPSPTPTPSPSPSPSPTPTGLYVLITSADWGDIAALTAVGASCNARVIVDSKDVPGVTNPKVADTSGTVQWTYPTPPTQTTGQMGEAIVTCSHNGLSGTSSNFFPVGT